MLTNNFDETDDITRDSIKFIFNETTPGRV